MPKASLKPEKHHWWPIGLQRAWCASDGFVSAIRPDGKTYRAKPGNKLGAIGDAHHIKIGGPWDTTFEPLFNRADTSIPELISWIAQLEASTVLSSRPIEERVLGNSLSVERTTQLASIVASLIARSPMTRAKIKSTVHYYSDLFSNPPRKNDDDIAKKEQTLIAANQRGLYEKYMGRLRSGGRWVVLLSSSLEFFMGDGFLHDFSIHGDAFSGTKVIVPILPSAAILYLRPTRYNTNPSFLTLVIDDAEVHEINRITSIYSKEFLFYSNTKPVLIDEFKCGEHRQFQYHRHEWLDGLLNSLSQFWVNEQNGSVGIGPHRPYGPATGVWEQLENFKKV